MLSPALGDLWSRNHQTITRKMNENEFCSNILGIKFTYIQRAFFNMINLKVL